MKTPFHAVLMISSFSTLSLELHLLEMMEFLADRIPNKVNHPGSEACVGEVSAEEDDWICSSFICQSCSPVNLTFLFYFAHRQLAVKKEYTLLDLLQHWVYRVYLLLIRNV
ncbi:hypothetical protein GOODEAATRI_021843 [Goodea atripinnis]|uniref:Secreted protein n=1 Tax=Goodea atripinnis TaxID=208336 RepID=A0ABV0P041_9TELE